MLSPQLSERQEERGREEAVNKVYREKRKLRQFRRLHSLKKQKLNVWKGQRAGLAKGRKSMKPGVP